MSSWNSKGDHLNGKIMNKISCNRFEILVACGKQSGFLETVACSLRSLF